MTDTVIFSQFLLIATAHFFAVASPGPDLAIVIKQSINHGKRHALITSVGIGIAIFIHVGYSALGVGLLIKESPMMFNILKYLCALYLIFIGYKSLSVKPNKAIFNPDVSIETKQHQLQAFNLGFITNVLNPKATLFFLSIFSVVITQEISNVWLSIYAVYLSLATMIWFCVISLVLSKDRVRSKFLMLGHYFDRLMGVILIFLAIKVAFTSL